jgi:hypothetical protein
MKQLKSLFVGICVSIVLLVGAGTGFGQGAVEPSYEVSMHILMGSDDSGTKSDIPSSLNSVTQQLKSKVGYSNFRLAGTIIGRMANQGNFEYKSYSDLFGQDPKFRSFIELTLRDLRPGVVDGALKFDTLRFGARIPIVTGYRKDEAGKDQPIVNYEQIGLTSGRLGVYENTPTLIGTLDVPSGTEMIFLVMTVKPLDR